MAHATFSVLGLDPGLTCTGYSIIRFGPRQDCRLVGCGTFRTSTKTPLADRLKDICARLRNVLEQFQPEHAAIEETFMAHNARSALLLGHIRGALLLTISQSGIPAFEYSPREVKMAVVGYGAAGKLQVRSMLTRILRQDIDQYPLDATDAIAVAVCHCHTNGSRTGKDSHKA